MRRPPTRTAPPPRLATAPILTRADMATKRRLRRILMLQLNPASD